MNILAYLPCTQFLEGEGLHDLDLIRVVADEAGHRGLADLVQLQDLCHTYVHLPIHICHKIINSLSLPDFPWMTRLGPQGRRRTCRPSWTWQTGREWDTCRCVRPCRLLPQEFLGSCQCRGQCPQYCHITLPTFWCCLQGCMASDPIILDDNLIRPKEINCSVLSKMVKSV